MELKEIIFVGIYLLSLLICVFMAILILLKDIRNKVYVNPTLVIVMFLIGSFPIINTIFAIILLIKKKITLIYKT